MSQATTAHEALKDLKRHCAQSSAYDKHSARKKVLNLTQNYGEKASEFLSRARKQIATANPLVEQLLHRHGKRLSSLEISLSTC